MNVRRSKIAIGTAQFGLHYGIGNQFGKTNPTEVAKILNTAYGNGIRVLDTAQAYGDSEQVIGRLHDQRFEIITKINPKSADSRSTKLILQESLGHLKTEQLYGLLFHSASSALQNSRIVSELKDLQQQGTIQKLGYSVYTPSELNTLISRYGKPDIIQIPFSHIDQRFEQIAIDLHTDGVEIHTRSTFLQGLFFRDRVELPNFFEPISSYLDNLRKNFSDNAQLAQVLLSFCLSKNFIDYVVLGVNNHAQLTENLNAARGYQGGLPVVPNYIPEKILLPYLWPK